MSLTLKRILIIFSVCLNIGFLASAAHHALSQEDQSRFRRHFVEALDSVDVSDVQYRAMLALEDRLHENMSQWRKETLHIKADSFEAMTAAGAPDRERMEANLDKEADIMRRRLEMAGEIFLEGRDVLGPEKLRRFGRALLADVEKR